MNEQEPWFPAKKYGYGWDLPCSWQGWIVFISYLVIVLGGVRYFASKPVIFIPVLVVSTVLLVLICVVKGEKPEWRWGNDSESMTENISWRSRIKSKLVPEQLIHLFIGPLIIAIGLFLYINQPTEINSKYGYRTEISRSSQEAWDDAQVLGAKSLMITGMISCIFQIVFIARMKPAFSILSSVCVLLILCYFSIYIAESVLKEEYEEHNNSQQINHSMKMEKFTIIS